MEFKEYADNDQSIYKHLSLAAYYSYRNETEKAIEHLGLFSEEDNYFYWITIFIPIEPMFDNIKDLPEFKAIMNERRSGAGRRPTAIGPFLSQEVRACRTASVPRSGRKPPPVGDGTHARP